MSVTHLAIPEFSQMTVTQFHNLGFSKSPSHIWQLQHFLKCPSHNLITQELLYVCQTFSNTSIFTKVRHNNLLTQDLPNVRHTFSITKITKHLSHNLITQDFENVYHTFGNTMIFPIVRHTIS